MDWMYYLKKLWYKIIYMVLVVIYIVKLDKLNKQILSKKFNSSFSLIAFDDYKPLEYFGIAALLIGIAIIITIKEFNSFRYKENDDRDIIIIICSIIAMIISILFIVKFISVPIFKAILISICLICGAVYVQTS